MALGSPAKHAAGKVGDLAEARALEDHRGLRRPAAGTANRDDGAFTIEFPDAVGEIAEREESGARNAAERAGKFSRLSHVEDLHLRGIQQAGFGQRKNLVMH